MLYSQSTEIHGRLQMYVWYQDYPKAEADVVQIVCKHFIEAIESSKYVWTILNFDFLLISIDYRFGWFWECPNGGEKCQYRHALPPGFVLKAQKKAEAEAARANVISLEEFLEVEAGLILLVYLFTRV